MSARLVAILTLGSIIGNLGGATAAPDPAAPEPVIERDIAFAQDDPRQVFHVYGFEADGVARPAVAIFHGGGLVEGSPEFEEPMALRIHSLGYVAVLVGYRLFDELTGANRWPAQLEDARRAIRTIRADADRIGIDPDRLCALGFSSGGQIAGLLGTTESDSDPDPRLDGISSRVDCVVSLAGDVDLMIPAEAAVLDRRMGWILGASRDERPDLWRAASPAHTVDGETVPFLVIHGADDLDVPVEASRNLAAALEVAGRDVEYVELPTNHFGARDAALTWERVEAFLQGQLRPSAGWTSETSGLVAGPWSRQALPPGVGRTAGSRDER